MRVFIPHFLHEKRNQNAVSDIFLSVVQHYDGNEFKFFALGDFSCRAHNFVVYARKNAFFRILTKIYQLMLARLIWTTQGDKLSYFICSISKKKLAVSLHADFETLKTNCKKRHRNDAYCKYGLFRLLRRADLIIASSKYGKKCLEKEFGGKVDYVYNGVEFDYFKDDHKTRNRPFTACFISRYIESKRPCLLLKIAESMPDIDFIMAGGEINQSYIAQHRIPDNVTSLGWVSREKVKEIYNSSDVMIFPSLSEGFGLVILEANACGLPVIASDIPVFRELINHHNGILVATGTPDEVESYVKAVRKIQNTRLHTRKYILDRKIFTWRAVSRKYLDLFKQRYSKTSEDRQ